MREEVVISTGTEELEIIDFGDASSETRQPHTIWQILDNAVQFTYA
jgi:hypothetical protein